MINGAGPLRSGKLLEPGVVTEADVDLLRRIIYSFGGDGNMAVTQPEAEILFDIDEATADADNHPAWGDLFVKAIANCVMAASGYAPPPREEALARDAWLDRRGDLSLDNDGCRHGWRPQEPVRRLQRAVRRGARHRPACPAEDRNRHQRGGDRWPRPAGWPSASAGDGRLTPNERALLMFLKAESPSIHPSLQALVDKAAAAA